ncbi:FAD/NAD(P)-dependent oxidoreductase [Falsiroseomonas tokyonensis]|uniref:NAD(P)/FAD-dependent oxidoreductase n=1 Tax=Falsiroseomonas tokyonensis TaxID=430521 RepID=A0ABV7BYG1_9PROT|nr:NAD(P)/FAD-dependent oxidoreductase [Falsiroseomonas tokyonensis]MBU8539672.1 FAD-dependent oxidoreductase [Falsiroseomonas tokyonensis]
MSYDIAVLGGGPAGMAAATEAAQRGARVVLLEESAAPGGQVYRAPPSGFIGPVDADRRAGDALRAALLASGAELRTGCRVWGVGGGPLVPQREPAAPFRLDALDSDGRSFAMEARALVLCCGTHERIIAFPGWTLPGVLGLAAATILLKAHGVLPGRRVVVAGAGPLLYAVAAKLLKAGAEVAAVVDLAHRTEWLRALPRLAARPDLLAQGLAWRATLVARGVRVIAGAGVTAARGDEVLQAVQVEGAWIACDALCIGHGLVPATEATRTFRAAHRYAPAEGGWVPVLDADQRCSVPLLYTAGDGAGVRGAAAAPASGRVAALAALHDLGLLPDHAAARVAPARDLARAAKAGGAMARMMALRPALVRAIPPETIVCRCEGVTRAEIEAACADGAADMNQMKQFTRCGMGPCQGRICGETAAELVGMHCGGREKAGFATGRLPLRPVPMDALLGEFDYADIPVPKPAPI